MESSELIKKIGEKIGIDLSPNDDNSYTLEVDEMLLSLHILLEIDTIILVGDIGEPPPEHLENLYKTMLESQHLFNGTGGATISLNSETNRFSLCKTLSCKILDADLLYEEAEQFVNTLEVWIKLVKDYRDVVPMVNEAKADDAPQFDANSFIRA